MFSEEKMCFHTQQVFSGNKTLDQQMVQLKQDSFWHEKHPKSTCVWSAHHHKADQKIQQRERERERDCTPKLLSNILIQEFFAKIFCFERKQTFLLLT